MRRSGGRSLEPVVEKLRSYGLDWPAYFGLAPTAQSLARSGRVAAL
ncbi:MAG: hypothetical protein Q8K34_04215 [Hydrogenophaga sp.]|nr:hypothetical protein [Hydrogenophaga sp.]MDO9567855.1 hypothetical protein [Hydrogenophaga sp.]MDP2093283.1 hypothetical protein [Hydrogenophaga sp.]MDP2219395.1 hypothetical protein [Hydrogenophaga sp.]MDP3373865.1 hypothetical protein [Hydrogenophaga sp.]MDP3925242.1 hypothetical protein [Hydrogenophaga sp.]